MARPVDRPPAMDTIDHVVVLMLENRSFDSVLGSLALDGVRVDGIRPDMTNADSAGLPIPVLPTTSRVTDPDPHHDLASVLEQLTGPNQGFVLNFESTLSPDRRDRRREVMDYHTAATMPVLHALAREYAVCDRWFCSVPAETFPNRLFVHAASSGGKVSDRPWRWFLPALYPMPTIFDRLGRELSAWACYNDQIPNMLLFQTLAEEFVRSRHAADSHFRSLDQFEGDCAADRLPRYAFIEPTYLFERADDDHPPHDLGAGERLVARIYLALRESPSWTRSVMVILFDEHGGFFDHVPPPVDVPAPGDRWSTDPELGFGFTRLGPRVPCLVVSPWTARGLVFGSTDATVFDHTSILATIRERWPEIEPLTERDRSARSIWHVLTEPVARVDDDGTVARIRALRADPTRVAPATRRPRLHGRTGRTAAVAVALAAPVASVPVVRQGAGLERSHRLLRSTAVMSAVVALRARGRNSTFVPSTSEPGTPAVT